MKSFYIVFMKKALQVYVDGAELERLERWARVRGWTKSQAVRVALRALLSTDEEEPLLMASGMIEGLPRDCGQQFDRYLEETFVAGTEAPFSRK